MDILIYIIVLLAGYLIGTKFIEKRHYKSILAREKKYSQETPAINLREFDDCQVVNTWLVSSNTVIASDVFKRFIAGFVNVFGGRVSVYEGLLDRARRESILRIQKKALEKGANGIVNLRIETSSISKGGRKNKTSSVEILAYGTAVKINN